MSLICK